MIINVIAFGGALERNILMYKCATVLKDIMKTRQITAAQLSQKSGLSRASISLWMNEKQKPSAKALVKLADALDVPVNVFSKDNPTATPDMQDTARINVPVAECAKLLGKSEQFVRVALRRGILPIGCAVNITGRRYTYYISPSKLNKYIGVE